jgi:hypothetical protein
MAKLDGNYAPARADSRYGLRPAISTFDCEEWPGPVR